MNNVLLTGIGNLAKSNTKFSSKNVKTVAYLLTKSPNRGPRPRTRDSESKTKDPKL